MINHFEFDHRDVLTLELLDIVINNRLIFYDGLRARAHRHLFLVAVVDHNLDDRKCAGRITGAFEFQEIR